MIVKYTRERDCQGEDKALTLGKDYLVLGISLERGIYSNGKKKEPYVCIRSDEDGYPSLFELKFFDVIDHRVPEGWNFSRLDSGAYYLEPQEFAGEFWEKFHDGEPNEIEKLLKKHRGEEEIDAQSIFKEVVKKIQLFHDWLPKDQSSEPEDPFAWPFEGYK